MGSSRREMVLVAHEAPTDGGFSLDALPSAGRMDLVARFLVAALLTSHGVRRDATARVVIRDRQELRVEGAGVRGLNPDERSAAGLVRSALSETVYGEREVAPGVYVAERGLAGALDAVDGALVWLHEDGEPAADVQPPERPAFVLSDHREFTESEVALLEGEADARLSLGPVALHADQAVAVAHGWCDTAGYGGY